MEKQENWVEKELRRNRKFREYMLYQRALVRVAVELHRIMKKHNVSDEELADRLGLTVRSVRRVLSANCRSLTLNKLVMYADALGYRVELSFVPEEGPVSFGKL